MKGIDFIWNRVRSFLGRIHRAASDYSLSCVFRVPAGDRRVKRGMTRLLRFTSCVGARVGTLRLGELSEGEPPLVDAGARQNSRQGAKCGLHEGKDELKTTLNVSRQVLKEVQLGQRLSNIGSGATERLYDVVWELKQDESSRDFVEETVRDFDFRKAFLVFKELEVIASACWKNKTVQNRAALSQAMSECVELSRELTKMQTSICDYVDFNKKSKRNPGA